MTLRRLRFPLLLDPDGEVSALFDVRGFPTSIVIDGNGEIYTASLYDAIETGLARS